MKVQNALIVALIASLPAVAMAATPQNDAGAIVATAPGKALGASFMDMYATVEAVNKTTREVTLKGEKGKLTTIVAGEEVKNFDQIKVGDTVVMKYRAALALELKKGNKHSVSREEKEVGTRANPGEKPSGTVVQQTKVMADVMKVDRKNQIITLRGPNRTVELFVEDASQLKNIKKGDQVEATFTEALAISVQPATAMPIK
jgi:hypothetical protein